MKAVTNPGARDSIGQREHRRYKGSQSRCSLNDLEIGYKGSQLRGRALELLAGDDHPQDFVTCSDAFPSQEWHRKMGSVTDQLRLKGPL